jgi:probable rRNA maturation factor
MGGATLAIVIQNTLGANRAPSAQKLRRWLRAAFKEHAGEITLRIVDEAEAAELNRKYRGRAGPTNVLSFRADELPPMVELDPKPLGDLVICASVVEQEAAAQGKSLDAHWAHMLVHGALHLLGHDHESAVEAEAMEQRERVLLAELGFSDPYD